MNNKPIGVFDSGIGGLTVLKKIIKVLPNEKYIYYADTDNVPYGTKPKEDVKKYVKEAVEFLIKNNVKVIVIACNTATSIAIKDLRNEYSLPIIGIEPAVKPAIENRCNKKVLVMATPITIREEKLHNLVNELNAESNVDLIAMPKLVEFAEAGEFDSNKVTEYLISQLKDFDLEKYSELVLGCTHFPFFKEEIRNVIPDSVNIIDGSQGVANRLKDVLTTEKLLGNNELKIEYYCSGKKSKNVDLFKKLLQRI